MRCQEVHSVRMYRFRLCGEIIVSVVAGYSIIEYPRKGNSAHDFIFLVNTMRCTAS